jgi:cysteine dioxygenase
MATHVVSRQGSIDNFISQLRKFSQASFDETADILAFLRNNPVASDTLRPYLVWDSQHYTRNLIDKTPLYELVAICWEIGQTSSVHNHRGQNCWMAAPVGRLLVENYHLVSQDLKTGHCNLEPAGTIEMNATQPCAVNPKEPVHRVLNPREFNQRAVTLHVYSRPFDSCVVYSPEQNVCGEIKLHYNSEYGKPVKS